VWLKYAFGEERRPGGDVGIEGFFPNRNQVYLPNVSGLATQGIRPNASGSFKASDMRMLGKALGDGNQRNTEYGGRWRCSRSRSVPATRRAWASASTPVPRGTWRCSPGNA
jgi:hypothetical protein